MKACLCKHGTINELNKQKQQFNNRFICQHLIFNAKPGQITSQIPLNCWWTFTYPNGKRKQSGSGGFTVRHVVTQTAQINQFVTYLHLIIAWIRSTKVLVWYPSQKCLCIQCDSIRVSITMRKKRQNFHRHQQQQRGKTKKTVFTNFHFDRIADMRWIPFSLTIKNVPVNACFRLYTNDCSNIKWLVFPSKRFRYQNKTKRFDCIAFILYRTEDIEDQPYAHTQTHT